jgi:hypothetical protein
MSDATAFALGPVCPSGPTQDGHPEAARIVVVDEDSRLGRQRLGHAPHSSGAARTLERAAVDRQADIVSVAHQEELRDVLHREREPDHAVAAIVPPACERRHDGRWDRQPVRRRVHLLLGEIQLTRADVLVGVELDLLEADHTRDDVHFAVRARGLVGRKRAAAND